MAARNVAGGGRWTLRHPVSLFGASLATVTVVLFLAAVAAELAGFGLNPYLTSLVFIALPALLVVALVLVPLGGWMESRRASRPYPRFDLNEPSHRRRLLLFAGLTAGNMMIFSIAGYRTIEHAESPEFCGLTCHSVMSPEYEAWKQSPHARVACVDCHTGRGAMGFVQAKINGMHQLASMVGGSWPRPIPTPVRNMRPARETCEHCHWPNLWQGERLRVHTTFASDEANTPTVSAVILRVGGGDPGRPLASGIHWHMNVGNTITYFPTDPERQTIPWVRLTRQNGESVEYLASGAQRPTEEDLKARGRTMDCIDCHNRPAHRFPTLEQAVDASLLAGRLPRDLPWARRAVVLGLSGDRSNADEAPGQIADTIRGIYAREYPEVAAAKAESIESATKEAVALYKQHVYPKMNVSWGAYPSFMGHEESPGCFRCHDGDHLDHEGKAINSDCETCHTLLEDAQVNALLPPPAP